MSANVEAQTKPITKKLISRAELDRVTYGWTWVLPAAGKGLDVAKKMWRVVTATSPAPLIPAAPAVEEWCSD